jgi:hypothetical protein
MYSFFSRRILGEEKDVKERHAEVEKLQDMLVWQGRALPPNALTYDQLAEHWIAAAKKQNESTHDVAVLRERLRLALATEWPVRVESEAHGDKVIFGRPGKGDRVSAIRIGTGIPSVVVIDSAPRKDISGPALLVTVFQTGEAVAPRNRSAEFFLTFNRSDDANRVQDILTALAYLKQEGAKQLHVTGTGRAAVWALFAAAVAAEPVTFDGKIENFAGQDRDYIEQFFVPGIQRAGGLEAALRVLGRVL